MIKLIYDGLSIEGDKVIYNPNIDNDNDIMNTLQPDIYRSKFIGRTYYFGYTFLPSSSRKDRTTIIKWLKNIDNLGIDDNTLRQFVDKPLYTLDDMIGFNDISCIVYPKSGRSNLTNIIVQEISNFSQRDTTKTTAEFVKSIPKEVNFDWEMFDSEYDGIIGDNQYKQIKDYVESTLLPKIHNLEYFSIADNVKPKYRRYIKDYLTVDSTSEHIIKSIQKGNILIVDDINTSGATLTEILRIVRKLNESCEIYIFTLIGKE